jgi:hypothetical protein
MSDSKSLNHDPLSEADAILTQDFYGQDGASAGRDHRRSRKPKPTHYKVICISMYTTDIERLEEKVAELKRRGYTKANKSQLIRMALSQIDLDKVTLPQP